MRERIIFFAFLTVFAADLAYAQAKTAEENASELMSTLGLSAEQASLSTKLRMGKNVEAIDKATDGQLKAMLSAERMKTLGGLRKERRENAMK